MVLPGFGGIRLELNPGWPAAVPAQAGRQAGSAPDVCVAVQHYAGPLVRHSKLQAPHTRDRTKIVTRVQPAAMGAATAAAGVHQHSPRRQQLLLMACRR
jgi:hypothetical protein